MAINGLTGTCKGETRRKEEKVLVRIVVVGPSFLDNGPIVLITWDSFFPIPGRPTIAQLKATQCTTVILWQTRAWRLLLGLSDAQLRMRT